MRNKQGKRYGRVNPVRIVEEANFRFIKIAEQLMNVVNWDRPIRLTNESFAEVPEPCVQVKKKEPRAQVQVPGEAVSFDDKTMQFKLKELFHQDAWHRLAAVRWIRQHRCPEAISALEGVLSIEESDEVRGEIEHALHVLAIRQASNKGEMRC